MKKFFRIAMIIAVAAMAFSACNKPDIKEQVNDEDFYYTFILGSPATKSVLSSDDNGKFGEWEEGDELGQAVNSSIGFAHITLPTETEPAKFKIYKSGGLKEGDMVYTYYPNSSASSVQAVPFEIPISQSQSGDVFDFDAMPMVGEEFVVTTTTTTNQTPIGEINLLNLGSVIDFQVYSDNSTYATETILSVKLTANKAIAGSFTKDIRGISSNDQSSLTISGYDKTSVTTSVSNPDAIGATRTAASHVYMVIAPESEVTGTVLVVTNKAEYTFNITSGQSFKRSGLKSFGLNLGTCQNRVAEELNSTTFVFNTTAGIQALGLKLPSLNDGTNVESVVSDCIVLTGSLGGNQSTHPRVWNNSNTYNFRVNKKNTITFSVSDGTIKSIIFDAGSKFHLTADGLTGTKWEGSANSVTFSNTDEDRTDINTITVFYVGGVAPVEPIQLVMSDIICSDPGENENSLTFVWDAVDNAEGYQVSTDGTNFNSTQSQTSYTLTNLLPNTTHSIWVKAIGDGTAYTDSNAVESDEGTTKALPSGTEQTIYVETFGSSSSNTAFASYSGYSATSSMFATTGAVNSHYSGSGSVGKNNLSGGNLSSGYDGASGLSGCYHVGTANTTTTILQISDINIADCENLSLSFGALGGSTSHKISVSYKIDGGSEKTLISNGAITNASWSLLSASIPDTGNSLTLIFKHTPTKAWTIRMDDIKVVGTK